jgi:hypothetical protein
MYAARTESNRSSNIARCGRLPLNFLRSCGLPRVERSSECSSTSVGAVRGVTTVGASLPIRARIRRPKDPRILVADFSNWNSQDDYQKAFERLLNDLKTDELKSKLRASRMYFRAQF